MPATISKSFVQTKEAALKDAYDEWLARIVCYAFSVPSQWAVAQMNRATAETAQQEADDEGLAPLLAWVKGALDRILRQCFGAPDLEFHWLLDQDEDNLAQAQVDQIYLATGVKSINEVRAEQGLAPVKGGELPLINGAGLVTLDKVGQGATPAAPMPPVAKYAPDQPRDEMGRWTSGRGGGSPAVDIHVADREHAQRQKPIQLADSGQIMSDAPLQLAAATEEEETRGEAEPSDPMAETRTRIYSNMSADLRRLEPDNKNLVSMTKPDTAPSREDLSAMSEELSEARERTADKISNGHAFDLHDEETACETPAQMKRGVLDVLESPGSLVKSLPRGRSAYYDKETNTIVLINPNDPDGGSVFRPRTGRQYFDELE